MRLNKFLASFAGYSRRDADEVIKQGRVSVNGEVVANLATFVKEKDEVSLDGAIISTKAKNVYLLLHKIKGYVTTTEDDKGRKTVLDLVKEPLITCACNKCKGLTAVDIKSARIYPIGRLDYDTEGLLLLTNDGDLSYRLTHPSLEIPKTYIAKLEGEIVESQLATLRKGVALDGVKTKPA
ncbi:MAG: rRNA pseudouridine synthase, partial [Firmicutes bacterium]|nr:rRNA pseudouridine synthase [Bacillota bacterium]